MSQKVRVAIIGAGISGLSCAYALRKATDLEVTVFEKGAHIGGHSNTIEFTPKNHSTSFPIDTGFLVFNEWTYPGLIAFFKELDVPVAKSEMSFSVSIPVKNGGRLEWAGDNLSTLFAQRKNLFNPAFLKMVLDILRFNRLGKRLAMLSDTDVVHESVEAFLLRHRFSQSFRDWYLLPMIGAIWSCSLTEMLSFPIHTLMKFCQNHGLLNVLNRPQWLTVEGGSKEYVSRVVKNLLSHGIHLQQEPVISCSRNLSDASNPISIQLMSGKTANFDKVIFACHADESLDLLNTPTQEEKNILGAIAYKTNQAYVHEDRSILPILEDVWAAWNYSCETLGVDGMDHSHAVCVHYLINKLQPIPVKAHEVPVVVSLNPQVLPHPDKTHQVIEYAHPIFNQAAVAAQALIPELQGLNHTYYCGAWTRYGFHEDGFQSGKRTALALLNSIKAS
jgi:predicted NAD/FAD-binding protein